MRRSAATLFLAALIATAASAADAPFEPVSYPDPEQIARLATACTARGAFDHRFGEAGMPGGGNLFATDPGWHPVGRTNGTATAQGEIFDIQGIVSFEHYPWSDDPKPAILRFVDALDDAIKAQGGFARRVPNEYGFVYYSDPKDDAQGFAYDISRIGVGIYLDCIDKTRAAASLRRGR